nr:putative late blight resistance protein homolog R1B-14 [Ipomoea batatas]
MIFEEQKRHEKFNIWVNVSQGFDRKQKFIDIIYQITNLREDISMMTEEGLAREICELLKEKKYFVVLDDVRKKEDWDSFKVALPTNLEGSRVLVTSPYGNVVDSNWKSHNLGTLSNEEGWLLLENSAFGTEKCNEKSIKNLGKEIANKCNKLPLALVAVGGMLRQCRNIADWQRVAENPFLEINGEGQIYRDRVKMTYNDLPNEKLKNCFLYFACFPMGHEIVVWKLIRLWIAEEFIPTIDEQGYALDVEVEAQKYLNDLVDRNLVRVVKQRINGQIKTCCIHNTLHEFCKSEAARINLFHVMDEGQRLDENTSSTPLENISSIRRLCFHSFTENKFDVFVKSYDQKRSLCPFGKHIHSLLLFSSQKGEVYFTEDNLLEIIANTFPLLRVLNIEFSNKLKFQRNELYNLHLLKYLAVKGNLGSLPKSLKNLRGLETLVIETTSRELQIDEGIWNMKKLRHVRTNVSMQLPFPPKRSATDSGGKNIRTLSTVLPKSCTEEIFRKTPNLQKLCVRGDLSEFLNKSKRSVFFKMLKCLENLKLYGKCDKVLMLPRFEQAPRLKRLTFSGTVFKWKDIIILGSLEELEVLKLDDYAFKGEVCDLRSNNIVFKRLQYLRIGRTNLVIWKVAQNNFPALQSLVLRNCSSLKSIPEAFANVHTLEVMELLDMSESAVQSAKEVKEKFTNRGFQLQLDITSKMGKGPMTAGTDTEAVKRLVRYVEWSAGPTGLYSELKDVSLDIEMINARLQDAYKNSIGPVNVFIVKNFQTIVNEAKDVAREYGFLTMKYEDKTLTKFLEPLRYRRNVKSFASKIQSVRSKMRTICEQYEYDLLSLTINRNNVLLTPQIETPIGFDKVIEKVEEAVNMLVQTVEDNVNLVSDIMESEIEGMISQIETFTESLVVACKNPQASEHRLLRLIVKKFGTHVDEARDAVAKCYFAQEKKHGLAKAFDKIRLCGKLNNVASEIQSIKEKVKTICEDYNDLRHLWEDYNEHSDLPPLKVPQKIYSLIIIFQITCFNNYYTRSHIRLHQYGI